MKRGWGARPLLEFEIISAQRISTSAMDTARKLGVCWNTYKKYAKMYGLFDKKKNKAGKGIVKESNPNKGTRPIDRIIKGEFPNFDYRKIKAKLIKAGIKEDKCDNCGYDEKRINDGKTSIIIVFKDENKKNHLLENIQFLCYNCCHNFEVPPFGKKKKRYKNTEVDLQEV